MGPGSDLSEESACRDSAGRAGRQSRHGLRRRVHHRSGPGRLGGSIAITTQSVVFDIADTKRVSCASEMKASRAHQLSALQASLQPLHAGRTDPRRKPSGQPRRPPAPDPAAGVTRPRSRRDRHTTALARLDPFLHRRHAPAGDRVKTNARDAAHLNRDLRIGQRPCEPEPGCFVWVRSPRLPCPKST